ncbi:MAG: 50S ribosomal protein L14 [Candidatus Doudnabacteria bacterium]|nr:50S ribosomal protein L14 [Candidatus Doudnabacteria bacterium]
MLQVRSWINIADNTGAKIVNVFSVNGKNSNRFARIGDIVAGSVKQVAPNSSLKKGDKVYAVIVRLRKEIRRKDGSYIRFDENAGVIVDKEKGEPKGSRIFGPIPREIREKAKGSFEDGFKKIVSLAPEVI